MAIISKNDFSGGETLRTRVNAGDPAILERCNGFKVEDGRLVPENVASNLTTGTALDTAVAEQTPFAFRQGGSTKIIGRNTDGTANNFGEHVTDAFTIGTDTIPIVTDSVPIRVGEQILYATEGANPRVMAYEPASASTKLRPLSFKSPNDYQDGAKPAVTVSATPAAQVFDIVVTTGEWTMESANYGSVTNTADKAVFTFGVDSGGWQTITAATKLATHAVANVALSGKSYLILDWMLSCQEEPIYPVAVFGNDPYLLPSGFVIKLYTDAGCTTEIAAYRLPRPTALGTVNRVAIALGSQTAVVAGIAICSDDLWTTPPEDKPYTVTLYSETFRDDWRHKGNFLLPAVSWKASPWAEKLSGLVTTPAGIVDVGLGNINRVTNGGFENGTTTNADNWTETPGAPSVTRSADLSNGGTYSMRFKDYNDHTCESDAFSAVAGTEITLGFSYQATYRKMRRRVTITYYTDAGGTSAVAGAGGSVSWPGAATYDLISVTGAWDKWEQKVTAPATALTARIKFTVNNDPTTRDGNLWIDDVYAYGSNQTATGSAVILQSFGEDATTDRVPDDPKVEWCYCFGGRDRLSTDGWNLMVSNPSDASTSDPNYTFADPWRTYALAVAHSRGAIAAVAAEAAGSSYEANDVLRVGSGEAKVKVLTVAGGQPATLELLTAGSGYTVASSTPTSNETDTAVSGATVNITDVITPADEYGDYLTHIFFYRRIYDGATETWSDWEYKAQVAYAASASWTDSDGQYDTVGLIEGREIPQTLELTNDYLGSAKHFAYADGRVYAACLGWENEPTTAYPSGHYARPTAIAVSSYQKPWAFTTTIDENSLATDGSELDGYAQTGSEVRAICVRNEQKFVFLDNEFFLLRGDNPMTGYQFIRIDSIGCVDARTVMDCRSMVIWHDGHQFYAYQGGGTAECISRFTIDSSSIDFTHALNSVYFDGKYLMWCEYEDTHCLLAFDTESGAWRVRRSDDGLPFVGICTDGNYVYGLTTNGKVFNLFGSSTTEATLTSTQSPTRQVWTRYLRIAPHGYDGQIKDCLLNATAPGTIDLSLELYTHGKLNQSKTSITYSLASTKTRYADEGANLQGDACQIRIEYTGTTPPTFHDIGLEVDDISAR